MAYKNASSSKKSSPIATFMDVYGLGVLPPGRYALKLSTITFNELNAALCAFVTVPPEGSHIETLPGFTGKPGDLFTALVGYDKDALVIIGNGKGGVAFGRYWGRHPVSEFYDSPSQLLNACKELRASRPVLAQLEKDGRVVYKNESVPLNGE